ncbi:MAG TPA: acyl-ACP--UDP-N-acetylglucosamine O-acyltransferase [Nevskiaceae bacterium]|nr:acyl-ACP--UDP-N-acetylglucosamine O-acyltransferase [Nevskiaceae bacterium]
MALACPRIHPTAVVDSHARLHETVEVGPYAIIGADVEVGEGTRIDAHAVLRGPLRVGKRNQIFPFATLGEVSQDLTAKRDDATRVEVGDDNLIREFVTIQRGTLKDTGLTRVGNHNLLMNYVHVGHDCVLGDHNVIANGTQLGGHIHIADWVVLGGAVLILQRCHLGSHCFAAGGSGITRDVPPFVVVQHNPAVARGINVEGLRRRGFGADDLRDIKLAYRKLFMSGLRLEAALTELAETAERSAAVRDMIGFMRSATHPVQAARSHL